MGNTESNTSTYSRFQHFREAILSTAILKDTTKWDTFWSIIDEPCTKDEIWSLFSMEFFSELKQTSPFNLAGLFCLCITTLANKIYTKHPVYLTRDSNVTYTALNSVSESSHSSQSSQSSTSQQHLASTRLSNIEVEKTDSASSSKSTNDFIVNPTGTKRNVITNGKLLLCTHVLTRFMTFLHSQASTSYEFEYEFMWNFTLPVGAVKKSLQAFQKEEDVLPSTKVATTTSTIINDVKKEIDTDANTQQDDVKKDIEEETQDAKEDANVKSENEDMDESAKSSESSESSESPEQHEQHEPNPNESSRITYDNEDDEQPEEYGSTSRASLASGRSTASTSTFQSTGITNDSNTNIDDDGDTRDVDSVSSSTSEMKIRSDSFNSNTDTSDLDLELATELAADNLLKEQIRENLLTFYTSHGAQQIKRYSPGIQLVHIMLCMTSLPSFTILDRIPDQNIFKLLDPVTTIFPIPAHMHNKLAKSSGNFSAQTTSSTSTSTSTSSASASPSLTTRTGDSIQDNILYSSIYPLLLWRLGYDQCIHLSNLSKLSEVAYNTPENIVINRLAVLDCILAMLSSNGVQAIQLSYELTNPNPKLGSGDNDGGDDDGRNDDGDDGRNDDPDNTTELNDGKRTTSSSSYKHNPPTAYNHSLRQYNRYLSEFTSAFSPVSTISLLPTFIYSLLNTAFASDSATFVAQSHKHEDLITKSIMLLCLTLDYVSFKDLVSMSSGLATGVGAGGVGPTAILSDEKQNDQVSQSSTQSSTQSVVPSTSTSTSISSPMSIYPNNNNMNITTTMDVNLFQCVIQGLSPSQSRLLLKNILVLLTNPIDVENSWVPYTTSVLPFITELLLLLFRLTEINPSFLQILSYFPEDPICVTSSSIISSSSVAGATSGSGNTALGTHNNSISTSTPASAISNSHTSLASSSMSSLAYLASYASYATPTALTSMLTYPSSSSLSVDDNYNHAMALLRICIFQLYQGRANVQMAPNTHISIFLLLRCSTSRSFCLALNQAYRNDLPLGTSAPGAGYALTHADLLVGILSIVLVHSTVTDTLFTISLLVLCNIAPYITSLSQKASRNLLVVTKKILSPEFVIGTHNPYQYIRLIFEVLSSLIQYQFHGNHILIKTILENSDIFRPYMSMDNFVEFIQSNTMLYEQEYGRVRALLQCGGYIQSTEPEETETEYGNREDREDKVAATRSRSRTDSDARGESTADSSSDTPTSVSRSGTITSTRTAATSKINKKEYEIKAPPIIHKQTIEIITSSYSRLPLVAVIQLIKAMKPRFDSLMKMKNYDAIESYIRAFSIVGVLPQPHLIYTRQYVPNINTDNWFSSLYWALYQVKTTAFPLLSFHKYATNERHSKHDIRKSKSTGSDSKSAINDTHTI